MSSSNCGVNCDNLAILNSALRRDGEQCPINTILDARQWLPLFQNAFHKFLVDLVKARMIPPSFSVSRVHSMNNWLFLICSTLPLQNLDSRNARHKHPTISNNAHLQIFAGKIQSEHAELQCPA